MLNRLQKIALLWCCIGMAGCANVPGPARDANDPVNQNNDGYTVLYKLMSDESNVDKVFILKHADERVSDLVKQVASFCQSSRSQLDEFAKRDPQLKFDAPALPLIELEARKLEANEQTKMLLGSSGKTFELRLVFTQVQAMDYSQKLTAALAEREKDASRESFLKNASQRSGELRDQLMDLLTTKS
jgi:hypothetical protein